MSLEKINGSLCFSFSNLANFAGDSVFDGAGMLN